MASTSKTAAFNLVALAEGTMPRLTCACGTLLAEAAVCLEERQHRSGATFHLTEVKAEQFLMEWPPWTTRPAAPTTTFRRPPSAGCGGSGFLDSGIS
jgi:hypothetical protein